MPPQRPRRYASRSAIDLSGSATGDVGMGDAAGRDIYHGVPADDLLRHLDSERQSRDAMAAMLQRMWERLDRMERAASDARAIDMESRLARQARLDADLAAIRAEYAAAWYWIRVALVMALLAIALALAILALR